MDLFGSTDKHDPGGKVRTRVPVGTLSDACFFGERDEHRLWLSRRWDDPCDRVGPAESMVLIPFELSIGMNPSTADATHNDPTIGRDIGFATERGVKMLYKCNMGSYRATKPADLKKPGVIPCVPENIRTIRELANNRYCMRVILCTGNLPKPLRMPADLIIKLLREDGRTLWCYGKNPSGDSRHPLYLKRGHPLEPF